MNTLEKNSDEGCWSPNGGRHGSDFNEAISLRDFVGLVCFVGILLHGSGLAVTIQSELPTEHTEHTEKIQIRAERQAVSMQSDIVTGEIDGNSVAKTRLQCSRKRAPVHLSINGYSDSDRLLFHQKSLRLHGHGLAGTMQ